jgi:hypothetical protein
MYCKFCEKDVQEEPSCATCGKRTVYSLGFWSRYSPALAWPFATWLIGFGVYRLIIAFQPALAPRLMRGLVVAVLIVVAKGAWATYCRHTFEARMRAGGKPTTPESDRVQAMSGIVDSNKLLEAGVSDEIILDSVPSP